MWPRASLTQTHPILKPPPELGVTIMPMLQMRKLSHRVARAVSPLHKVAHVLSLPRLLKHSLPLPPHLQQHQETGPVTSRARQKYFYLLRL